MNNYLFAYGTLAEESAPREIANVAKHLEYVGDGFVFGRLYDVGEYPGAVLESERRHKIFGKIYRLPVRNNVLKQIDAYEGFDPTRRGESLFVRKRTTIKRPKKSALVGWVYEYNRSVNSLSLIRDGRYSK